MAAQSLFKKALAALPLTNLRSVFRSKVVDDGNNNDPNHRLNSECPQESSTCPPAPQDCRLDIEALKSRANNYHDDTSSLHSPSSATATQSQEAISNPIAQLFEDQDLGKTIVGFLMPITAAFLNPLSPASALLKMLIFLSLSLGLAALWNGILLRRVLPRYAIFIEQIGAVLVLLAFYGLVSSFLPHYLIWFPFFGFLLVLFPFFWSYYLGRITRVMDFLQI